MDDTPVLGGVLHAPARMTRDERIAALIESMYPQWKVTPEADGAWTATKCTPPTPAEADRKVLAEFTESSHDALLTTIGQQHRLLHGPP